MDFGWATGLPQAPCLLGLSARQKPVEIMCLRIMTVQVPNEDGHTLIFATSCKASVQSFRRVIDRECYAN